MTIAATPEQVWALVTDVSRIAQWWPRAVSGSVIDGEGVGRTQTIELDWGRRRATVRQRVTAWEPPYRYGWRVVGERFGDRDLPPVADQQISIDVARDGPLARVAILGMYEPIGPRGAIAVRQIARLARHTFKDALHRIEAAITQR